MIGYERLVICGVKNCIFTRPRESIRGSFDMKATSLAIFVVAYCEIAACPALVFSCDSFATSKVFVVPVVELDMTVCTKLVMYHSESPADIYTESSCG